MHPVSLPVAFISFFTSVCGSFGALSTDPNQPENLPTDALCTVLGHKCVYTCRAGSLRLVDSVMIEVKRSIADLILTVHHDVYYLCTTV
ncbi:hypothetical protein SCLCIDRAFT_1214504 [Scleroderma citrinum Foug A]|uniref:Secreted protein n=1 Tax=Scleroderma citrinum Foug A TaxID=1036808 RepID=A0A0C3E3A5_9AGAM|nr:hypothetical protein SCLCIDRAFT_1214504 [Scleroderma citrinum Foug A]